MTECLRKKLSLCANFEAKKVCNDGSCIHLRSVALILSKKSKSLHSSGQLFLDAEPIPLYPSPCFRPSFTRESCVHPVQYLLIFTVSKIYFRFSLKKTNDRWLWMYLFLSYTLVCLSIPNNYKTWRSFDVMKKTVNIFMVYLLLLLQVVDCFRPIGPSRTYQKNHWQRWCKFN